MQDFPGSDHLVLLRFQSPYLLYACDMPASLEFRVQEGLGDFYGQPWPDNVFAEAEYVGIIVHSGTPRREDVLTDGSPDTVNLVGSHAHPDASTAYQDAE